MKKQLYALALICFFIFPATGLKAQQKINTRGIDSLLEYLYQQNRFMGAVNIRQDGKTVFNKAYGIRGMQGGQALEANPDTRYRIGSVTKIFTAVMMMQLVEEHRLSLEDKLSRFFKDIPNADQITIRQLLSHQSGLYNYTNDPDWVNVTQFISKEAMLKKLAAQKPDFEPGARMEYSNTNYVLLGYIIEQLTGLSYNEALQQRICKKAGLHGLSLPAGNADMEKNESLSFAFEDNKWTPVPETHVSAAAGAGGIIASAAGTDQFMEALFQNKLLQKESLEEMMPKAGSGKISELNSYGLGVFSMPFGDKTGYGHNGHIDAFFTSVGYFPVDKITFSIFANGLEMSLNDIAIGVLSLIYNKPYTFPDFKAVALSENELKGLAGIYSAPDFPMKITITQKQGALWAQATGQGAFPTVALNANKFEFKEAGILLEFKRNAAGLATGMMLTQHGNKIPFVPEDSTVTGQTIIQVDGAVLSGYEGVYSTPTFPLKITIKKEGSQLTAQATGQSAFNLDAISDTEFKFDDAGILITFKKNAAGTTTGLTLKQGASYELDKE